MARQMPKAGFYVMHDRGTYGVLLQQGYKDCVYTTGKRGGGGHKYYRDMGTVGGRNPNTSPFVPQWATLLWSCVPNAKELAAEYDYYPTWNAIPASAGIPKP